MCVCVCVCVCRSPDWKEAVRWYRTALETPLPHQNDEEDSMMSEPDYLLLSQLAKLLGEGGHELGGPDHQEAGDCYQQAADAAMAAMKGKLANRFYQLAEEEWSKVPDDT